MNKFLTTEIDIRKWLKEHSIDNYDLVPNDIYGSVVNVRGSVDLKGMKLSFIPVKFGQIDGDFNCSHNQLKSLEFAPSQVKKDFYCHKNRITSLEYSPQEVGGVFACSFNQLKTLSGGPQTVGRSFLCDNNMLTSLEFCPTEVGAHLNCSSNQLENLGFFPKKVGFGTLAINNPLLGEAQHIKEFDTIFKLHEEFVIKKEKLRLEADVEPVHLSIDRKPTVKI